MTRPRPLMQLVALLVGLTLAALAGPAPRSPVARAPRGQPTLTDPQQRSTLIATEPGSVRTARPGENRSGPPHGWAPAAALPGGSYALLPADGTEVELCGSASPPAHAAIRLERARAPPPGA